MCIRDSQGLDLAPAAHEAAGVLRVLAAGDRFHDADRPPSARAAGQLRRAQDGGGGRHVYVVADDAALRCASDAARIEELRLRIEEGRVVAGPAAREVREDLRSLGEEGPLLLEEGLVGGE